MKILFLTVAFLLGSTAWADQCIYISPIGTEFGNSENPKQTADNAAEMLRNANQWHHFCELCGDLEPKPIAKGEVTVTEWPDFSAPGVSDYTVNVDGDSIDLAYTYADELNVAIANDCLVHGVTKDL